MGTRERLKEDIVSNIRACLVSTKTHCTLRQLNNDYKTLIGTDIDYRTFQFRSLEEFIRSIDTLKVTTVNGQTYIEAKSNEKSQHLAELVSKQKHAKKKNNYSKGVRGYRRLGPIEKRWRPRNLIEKDYKRGGGDYYDDRKRNESRNEFTVHRQYVNKVDNNNTVEIKDLRGVLNDRKKVLKVSSEKTNINKIMEGIDLKSFTKDVKLRAKKQQLQYSGDPVLDLEAFTKCYELPDPQYTVINRRLKHPPKILFDCKLKIENSTYSNYPEEFCDETAVKRFVANKALEDLKKKHEKRASLVTSTDQEVLERIPELVKKHFNGIWMWQVESDYTDLFKEILPINWLDIIRKSEDLMISVYTVSENRSFLIFCKPEDVFQKGKRFGSSAFVHDVSVPTNVVSFGENAIITAEITCVGSAKEIWCRQLETSESEAFDSMVDDFNTAYNLRLQMRKVRKPVKISKGGFYAVLYEGTWYRVRVFEVIGTKASCFFIDYGDEIEIDEKNVFLLEEEFARRQAQAFICRLAGLEELYEMSIQSDCLQELLLKVVQLETENIETASSDDLTAAISAVFYDLETNESINQKLIGEITKELASPMLNKNGITEVTVTHITQDGDLFVNVISPGFEKITSLIKNLESNIVNCPPNVVKTHLNRENDLNKLFFIPWAKNGRYYRAQVVDFSPKSEKTVAGEYVQFLFIDEGFYDVVKASGGKFYPLELLSDVMNQFPAQALKVKMEMEKISENYGLKVREMVSEGEKVLLTVVGECNENLYGRSELISVVKIFKRVGDILHSVNDLIKYDDRQKSARSSPERLQRLISLKIEDSKNVPSTGNLVEPPLPGIGNYFDVKVPTAVNPLNFFVQPFGTKQKLDKLMEEMQICYEKPTYSPLQLDDVLPGQIYASKHGDNKWYRTSVIKMINPSSISVFYCDFGHYSSVAVNQLIPLESRFLDLPYQAIKARLHGIAPRQSKWTMDDCQTFQKLVQKKAFVSVIKNVEKDELYGYDNVLVLELIDTSTEKDIYIDQVLIEKGIAVKTDEC